MKIKSVGINGLLLIQPKVFEDPRGYFLETYNKNLFNQIGIVGEFVQDNLSKSDKDVLRGLHFQKEPHAQGKLVRVIFGSVLDVVVDIRKNSPTFGKHFKCILSQDNHTMLWVPPGFAHGFLTLENNTIFAYKCTQFYNKEAEDAILWNDSELNIQWDIDNPIVSDKDKNAKLFKHI